MKTSRHHFPTAAVLMLLASGCPSMNHTQSGAMVGGGLGALTGAVIGSNSGHAPGGALIGAAVGALAGGTIGNSEDLRDERDHAIMQAAYEQQARAALTNFDLVRMVQGGMGDDVIISSIQTRGGRFDLGTEALINLKANGVSDRVIVAMQQAVSGVGQPPAVVGPAPVVVPGPPVIVHPAPVFVGPPPPPPGVFFEFHGGGRRRH
ncbi:YMGG-like glycine zipper-containing protein [Caulifigura coniformis]|nr:glycine zipper domain-containing protein [Caulifigura coniformis]